MSRDYADFPASARRLPPDCPPAGPVTKADADAQAERAFWRGVMVGAAFPLAIGIGIALGVTSVFA